MARAIFLLAVLMALSYTSQALPQMDDKSKDKELYFVPEMIGHVNDFTQDILQATKELVDGTLGEVEKLGRGMRQNMKDLLKGSRGKYTENVAVASFMDECKEKLNEIINKISDQVQKFKNKISEIKKKHA